MPISECREKETNMDWSKAKNIILVLLLLLNIFLLVNIINIKMAFETSREYRVNAQKALTGLNIEINCSIPSSNKPVQRISFVEKDKNVYTEMIRSLMGNTEGRTEDSKSVYYAGGKTLEFFDNRFIYTDNTNSVTVPVVNRKRLDKTLRNWIRKNKISKADFVLDNIYQEDGTVIAEYVQLYNKMPVFSNKITFKIDNGILVQAEGSCRIFYDLRANKEDDVVSAEIVLLTNKDMIRGAVESIDLGYYLAQKDELHDTPVWRIKTSTGGELLFNAITGEWIDLNHM